MKLAIITAASLVLFASQSLCQIPNVYEFCSALMSDDRRVQSPPCSPNGCSGRPGKRGSIGMPGPPGLKGDRGEQGSCERLEERQAILEAQIRDKFDLLPKLIYCSMGMKYGDIPDKDITASSQHDYRFAPRLGRLDGKEIKSSATDIISVGAWCPNTVNSGQWIQVDLGKPKSVAGVITQGRPPNRWGNCWAKLFKISCGPSADALSTITENGAEKIFIGNVDEDGKVINKFPQPMTCRVIRLYPLTWNTDSPWIRVCMRLEILKGECFDLF